MVIYTRVMHGESVNRPRYTVSHWLFIGFVVWYWHASSVFNEEAQWEAMVLKLPTLDYSFFRDLFILMQFFGIEVEWPRIRFGELATKASSVFKDFLNNTALLYRGIHRIKLNNVSAVLHPVDIFLKGYYERYFPVQAAQAFSTYKRTNPTLKLKLDHLEKYAEPNVKNIDVEGLKISVNEIIEEVKTHKLFPKLKREISVNVREERFDDLVIDGSSASGYPFPQGNKKKDDFITASNHAREMLHDEVAFDNYIFDHVWYTTGRAKMQEIGAAISGRLIVYAGFAGLLIAMLFVQPWAFFMNQAFDWCGVGFSWMNGGANKFAKMFQAEHGFAPPGYRYVSVDISGWDTKLHPGLMQTLKLFYMKLMDVMELPSGYRNKLLRLVQDMIEAVILMPLGYAFQVFQGMKSGWANTANDNTLMHEFVFRCIMRSLGYMMHILYGDDNFMLVPDHISDEDIVKAYLSFGLVVKRIHSSRCISDVDFLSKRVMYSAGNYYVYRDAVETHARLLMPEEIDPRRRDRPDPIIAIERLLGHLLDNPFNSDVRNVCYSLLEKLKEAYDIHFITVGQDLRRQHPWRNFPPHLIPRKFPTVPSMLFIEELYGVPFPSELRLVIPAYDGFVRFDRVLTDVDSAMYDVAIGYSNDVAYRMNQVVGKNYKVLVRKLSPFSQPKRSYGFHAARFEFAVKHFGIRFNNLLDLGSHPGACAASAVKYCKHIVCVSKKPAVDKRAFCPYVVREANVVLVKTDANHFVPYRPFDLQHDDVDIVGARSVDQDIEIGLGMIRRALMNKDKVEQCLFTLKEVDGKIKDALYELYLAYGYIDFVKPLFSNPWKSEIMVYTKRVTDPRMRRVRFRYLVNGFLNSLAPSLLAWSQLLASAITSYAGLGDIPVNPMQTDAFEHEWLKPWVRSEDDGRATGIHIRSEKDL